MLTVIVFGWLLKRPSDLINSLFAAALIILVWQPQQLFQAGFQLSFFVVLCILLSIPLLRDLWERMWAPRSAAAGVFLYPRWAHYPARSWSIRQRSPLNLVRGVDWLHPTGRILFSHCDAGEYAQRICWPCRCADWFLIDGAIWKFAVCGVGFRPQRFY